MAKLSIAFALFIGLLVGVATAGRGYVTYHMYTSDFPLASCACSDGANGLMTRFRQSTVGKWWPGVSAASFATWNSPNCGGCYRLTNNGNGRSVYVTVIYQCGTVGGFDAHFDISPPAFADLVGSLDAGHTEVSYDRVSDQPCN